MRSPLARMCCQMILILLGIGLGIHLHTILETHGVDSWSVVPWGAVLAAIGILTGISFGLTLKGPSHDQ